MTEVSQAFIDKSRNLLLSDYLPKIERCLDRLSDEDIWWRPNEASNSIGNLVLHLCGNVTQWIVGGVGGQVVERDRQQEFDERRRIPAAELRRRLKAVIEQADQVMRAMDSASLLSERDIQGDRVTVLEAIYQVVEHFGMHTGQIILLSKARAGEDLNLGQPPP